MRIVVNGQQAFGKAVLDALVARSEDVVAVYCAPDARPDRPDPLKAAAGERGLPVFQPKSFRDPAVHEEFAALKPDLCVMAYVTKIVPSSFLDLPVLGTIQYHPSLLPLHRGPSSINWPIIQGRKETGLTIFWPDDGLDTGPVLLQKKTAIGPDDTLGSIYFDRLFPMGVDAMLEAVDLVRDGKAPKLAQDEAEATYESWCTAEDAGIDWSRPPAKSTTSFAAATRSPAPGPCATAQNSRYSMRASRKPRPGPGPARSCLSAKTAPSSPPAAAAARYARSGSARRVPARSPRPRRGWNPEKSWAASPDFGPNPNRRPGLRAGAQP